MDGQVTLAAGYQGFTLAGRQHLYPEGSFAAFVNDPPDGCGVSPLAYLASWVS